MGKRRRQKTSVRRVHPRIAASTPASYAMRNSLVKSDDEKDKKAESIPTFGVGNMLKATYYIHIAGIGPNIFNIFFFQNTELRWLQITTLFIFAGSLVITGALAVNYLRKYLWKGLIKIVDGADRRRAVISFSVALFGFFSALIPILMYSGLLAIVRNLIPGKTKVTDTLSVTGSFLVTAAISGILGNFLYDLLKNWYLKRKR